MKPSEHLRQAKALISTPENWCKGALHQPPSQYDMMGALMLKRLSFSYEALNSFDAFNILRAAIGDELSSWNDWPGRTHAEVMKAFDDAIVLAEGKGQ